MALLPPQSRRHLSETPGISGISFLNAAVATSNIGGWCGYYCQHVNNGASGDPPGYDTDTGTCADPATPYAPSGQYTYNPSQYEDPPECSPDDEQMMLLTGVGQTTSGISIDLRITNQSAYVPWNANQNGLNGDWAEINVVGNEPVRFEVCFIDHVRNSPVVVASWKG